MAASHARTGARVFVSYAGDMVLLPTHPDVLFFESCILAPNASLPLFVGAGAVGSLAMASVLEICAGTSIFIDLADALIPDLVPRTLVSALLLAHGAKAVALTAALPLRHAPVAVVVLAAAASGNARFRRFWAPRCGSQPSRTSSAPRLAGCIASASATTSPPRAAAPNCCRERALPTEVS